MANPSYVVETNVRFNGTLDNAVTLSTAGGKRKLILWDDLSVNDQLIVEGFVTANGGTAPATLPATSGKAVLDYGSAVGSTATGLVAGSAATAGRQVIKVTSTTAGTATGLANDTTAYTATVTVDGTAVPVSIVGSAAQTVGTLISSLSTQLTGKATVASSGSTDIVVTSATTGAGSTVAIQDGTLFAAVTVFTALSPAVPGAAAVPAQTYTATITIDGVAKPISVLGSAATTFTTLVSAVSTAIGSAGTAALQSGKITITSATTGASSTVVVNNGTLFGAVAGFVSKAQTAGTNASDLWDLFQTTRSPNGALYSDVIKVTIVGNKPAVPIGTPHTPAFLYYSGTEWLYLDDDTPFCE